MSKKIKIAIDAMGGENSPEKNIQNPNKIVKVSPNKKFFPENPSVPKINSPRDCPL